MHRFFRRTDIGILIGCIFIFILFSLWNHDQWFNWYTFTSISRYTAILGLLAIGQTFVILIREIDLSVGSVYGAIGGHAYGWVYPGPIGAVLTPQLIGVEEAGNLPNASTFCGRCESVCPVRIPLPKLMRHWREREFERHLTPAAVRQGLALWGFFARRPALYRRLTTFWTLASLLFWCGCWAGTGSFCRHFLPNLRPESI